MFRKFAALAMVAGALIAGSSAAVAKNLEIFIENNTDYVLDFNSQSTSSGGWDNAPLTIDANTTSQNIDLTHKFDVGKGKISYQQNGGACALTINVKNYDIESGKCTHVQIDPTTTGGCSIKSKGCVDDGCHCTFSFSD